MRGFVLSIRSLLWNVRTGKRAPAPPQVVRKFVDEDGNEIAEVARLEVQGHIDAPGPGEELRHLPELVGYTTDEHGKKVAVYRSPRQHAALTPHQMTRVARLREALAEVYPLTMLAWVDGFLRDVDPESSISDLEACAAVYLDLAARDSALTVESKSTIYVSVLRVSGGTALDADELRVLNGVGIGTGVQLLSAYREALAKGRRP